MKRCERCIMPETVPGITFNDSGVCCYCLAYKEQELLPEEEFNEIIATAKKKGSRYDCVVPLSGGRDSSFILYLARVVYDMKVLAVNYDNEFRSEQALINMTTACKLLNIDFLTVRSRRNLATRIVRGGIRSVLPFGLSAVSTVFCRACTVGYRSLVYRAAEEHHVPLILWGESKAEATADMQSRARDKPRRSKWLRLLQPSFYTTEYYSLLHRREFFVPGNRLLARTTPVLKNENIHEVRIFDYIRWDRQRIKEIIMSKLGWSAPQGHVSTWRTDCLLHPFMNFCFLGMFGCSKDCFGYCNMINSGQMSRTQALKQEEEMACISEGRMRDLLENKVGLTKKEVDRILLAASERVHLVP
jgi:hypothetical protein